MSTILSCDAVVNSFLFFFNDPATTEIYTLSLHDALPICAERGTGGVVRGTSSRGQGDRRQGDPGRDRKSTRLNSSHANISYAVFCLKKKIKINLAPPALARNNLKLAAQAALRFIHFGKFA